jgi:hypothetical protein
MTSGTVLSAREREADAGAGERWAGPSGWAGRAHARTSERAGWAGPNRKEEEKQPEFGFVFVFVFLFQINE